MIAKANKTQMARMSNILDNLSQVIAGLTVVNPLIVGGIDSTKAIMILSGVVATLVLWLISIRLARG